MAHEEWEKYEDIDPYEHDDKPRPDETPREEHEYDSNGNEYNPNAGSQTPTKGRCNCLLTNYMERYGEPRYCTRLPKKYFDEEGADGPDFCQLHQGRKGLMERAEELFEYGFYTKTIHHFFDKVEPIEKVTIIALFEDLLEDSKYDFDIEEVPYEIDVSDQSHIPVEDGTETIDVAFPEPNAKTHRANALWQASINEVKKMKINSKLMDPEDEEGGLDGVSVSHTGTNEAGKIVDRVEEATESHLNLPLSRLVKDQKENLKIGGVEVDSDTDIDISVGEGEEWKGETEMPKPEVIDEDPPVVDTEKAEEEYEEVQTSST